MWGSDGLAAGTELFGGPASAGSGGDRRRHGGAGGGASVSGQRVLYLQGADPASPHRRGQRQLASRSPAAQADAVAGSRLGGAHHGSSRPHLGVLANVAVDHARGSALERRDVVG